MKSWNIKFLLWCAAIIGSFFLLGAWTHDKDGLFGQTSAAWVQAIGSIATIGAGFAVLAMQENSRAGHNQQEEERAARWVLELATKSIVGIKGAMRLIDEGINLNTPHKTTEVVIRSQRLSVIDDQFGAINPLKLPHSELINEYLTFHINIKKVLEILPVAEYNINNNFDMKEEIKSLEDVLSSTEDRVMEYQKLMDRFKISKA